MTFHDVLILYSLYYNLKQPLFGDADGGGWLVVQRRASKDVDFYRGWNDYKYGFGDLKVLAIISFCV